MSSQPSHTAVRQASEAARAHFRAGRVEEAERLYQKILELDPANVDALFMLAGIAHQSGSYERALQLLQRAVQHGAATPQLFNNLGEAQRILGKLPDALKAYDAALKLKPDYPEALNNKGLVLSSRNRHAEAIACYDRALALKPDYFRATLNRARTLYLAGRFGDALAGCDAALRLEPAAAEALNQRGLSLHALGRYAEAVASYQQAIDKHPRYAEALGNQGAALHKLNRFQEAVSKYDKALSINAKFAEAHNNRGLALQALKRFDEALDSFGKAYEINPKFAEAHLNEGMCRLLTGDFERGWREYEWRWSSAPLASERSRFSEPLWSGVEDVRGKTVLLQCEQGHGDTIQFSRYATLLAARGARVILEAQPGLRTLLASVAGVHQVVARGDRLPHFDLYCPLLSLPLAFRTRLDTIPAEAQYLKAPSSAIQKWRAKVSPLAAPRIGLAWSGRPAHSEDHNRSLRLSTLLEVGSLGATLISLQVDVRDEDKPTLTRNPRIAHFGAELADFMDTAGLVETVDLVLSVDTSVAHLAGALGKPVWVLLPFVPDWRWLLDREDSPWYPTARLFRQPKMGDWDSVVKTVISALKAEPWLRAAKQSPVARPRGKSPATSSTSRGRKQPTKRRRK